MNTDDIATKAVNPWVPITDPKQLRLLGKMGEELGEGVSAICRAIIQGINERHPVSGKPNKVWLEEELADMYACADIAIERLKLDIDHIMRRAKAKKQYMISWHNDVIADENAKEARLHRLVEAAWRYSRTSELPGETMPEEVFKAIMEQGGD